jgi:non-heme chloroperoxidase
MLPAESRLEVRKRLPTNESRKPPLLFVHGGYCDAWFWEPYFLPWFAARGYPAYALSLRGHGAGAGSDTLFMAGLGDYEADVERIAATIDSPPILIGHSMGAVIVEHIMAKRPVRGAALLAPIPPAGLLPIASRRATSHPAENIHKGGVAPSRQSANVLQALRPGYFGTHLAPNNNPEAATHQNAH